MVVVCGVFWLVVWVGLFDFGVVCLFVLEGGGFGFLVGFDQQVELRSLCYVRDDVLNYCTCEFQVSCLSSPKLPVSTVPSSSCPCCDTSAGAVQPGFNRPAAQLCAASYIH